MRGYTDEEQTSVKAGGAVKHWQGQRNGIWIEQAGFDENWTSKTTCSRTSSLKEKVIGGHFHPSV